MNQVARRRSSRCVRPHFFLAGALLLLSSIATAAPSDPLRYQGGIRNSTEGRRLNDKQLGAVLKSLREKTGFLDLHYDADGFLRLADRERVEGGSAAARALVIAAVDAVQLIELENHSRSPVVAFARLAPPIRYESRMTGKQIEVQPLELDFSDFSHLRGDREVVAAFDLGFGVLHELVHAVLDLRDAGEGHAGPGDCEDYVNRIRRELRLPERQHYYARVRDVANFPQAGTVKRAELIFARVVEQGGRTRTEHFYLNWEAQQVGRIVPYSQGTVRSSTVAMQ